MKIVVFEHLRRTHLALVTLYLRLGYSIRFVEADSNFPLLTYASGKHAGRVEALRNFHLNPTRGGAVAFDLVERFFKQDHPLINAAVRLYGSESVVLAFKKSMTWELEKAWTYTVLNRHLRSVYPNAQVSVIPKSASTFARAASWAAEFHKAPSSGDFSLPALTWVAYFFCRWSAIQNKFYGLAVCGHYILISLLKSLTPRKRLRLQRFRFGICIVSPQREFANAVRGVGFLLDHETVSTANTLFIPIVPLTRDQKAILNARGLQFADIWDPPAWSTFGKLILQTMNLATRTWLSPHYVSRTYAFLLREYGLWTSFLQRFSIESLISYSDVAPPHIGRNAVLRSNGVGTWYYIDSMNCWDVHLQDDDVTPYRDQHWGYISYDYCVAWSGRFIEFLQRHPQQISHYLNVGCIWSEHVRLISAGNMPSQVKEELRRHGLQPHHKIVGAFDSTYGNSSLTPYSDGVAFAKGLLKLVQDVPELFVVIKEKKPRDHFGPGAELAKTYEMLQNASRCFFVGNKLSASEIVAFADLTISFPFTSTAIEALGCRRKAIYFDAMHKYEGTYYDSVPGLIAHGYEGLRQRVKQLLFTTSEKEYDRYLDEFIKGEIEPFLDGYGLSRFRELLLMEDPGQDKLRPAVMTASGLTT